MKTKKSRLFILTVICVLSAFFACAFMFSPASDNKENVVYAAGTSETITTGRFFTSASNSSNGWNIQDVENWKTSGKAISFDYKNNTGAAFTSFWFAGYTSGSKQLTSQITVNLSSNTCSDAVITELGDGWYNLTLSYAAMNVNNNTETTINWIYFAGIGGKSLSLNNMNTLADEKFNPVTITTGTFYSSGWHIDGVENWKTSGYALSFDYKNNTGDSFTSFYFRGYSDNTVVTGDITVDLVNNMARSGNDSVATVTSLGDGWYRVLANYENIPKSNDGTLNKIYFAGIGGNSLSLNNITFKATAHSDGLASKLTAGAVYTSSNPAARNWNITDVANWKTSNKALYFEYKNISGAAFYITPQSSSTSVGRQITVAADNTVSFWNDAGSAMKYGIVKSLGSGWYGVTINYKDLGVAGGNASNGEATLSQFYFTGVGSNVIYVNNFDTEASPIFTVSVTGGTIGGESSANIGDGQTATVIAGAPAAGKYFHHWAVGGESVSTDAEYTFTVDSDVAITAVYYDFHGTHVTAAWSTPSTATYNLDYDTVTFDYKPVGSNTAKIAIANTDWSKFYGYYTFTSTGTVDKTTGVSITPLDDGYFRVVMTTASLTWTNSANNRNNVPDFVNRIITNTASDWYIDNVVYYKACTVTVTNGTGGTTVNYGTSVTVIANAPAAGKAFAGWSDGESIVSENSSYTFTATGDVSLTATYGDLYTVSVTGGTINGESSAEIGEGQTATVIAGTPATGKYFHHWEIGGESVSTDAEYTFTVDSDVAITAVYYDFHGTHITTGGVWASESPYKIVYDTVTFDYKPVGTNVVRVCLFQPWSKYYGYYSFTSTGTVNRTAGISITPLDDGYYRVVMTIASLAWTNDANNLNNAPDQIEGIWTAPASDYYIDNVSWYKACTITVTNGTGGTTVNYGTSVTVVANSAPTGKYFAGWSDGENVVSGNNSYTFTATGDVSLTATYGDLCTVSVTGGTINGESSAEVVEGQLVTVIAGTPATGKYFHHWEIGGESVSTDAEYSFVVDGDVSLTSVYNDFHGTRINFAGEGFAIAPYDVDYDTVTFDYKPVGSNTVKICLLNKGWTKYYGYYTFTSTGTVDRTTGVSITPLDDGYYRVVMTTASLAWTNSANNRNNVPEHIHCFNCGASSDWYIDNVVYYKACTITVTNGTGGDTVNYGTSVTVVANAPAAGKVFAGWSDGESIVSESSSYTFTATGDISLTATYGGLYTVSVTGGTINGESSAEVVEGQLVTVIAGTPATGKYFHHWEVGGESVSTDAEYSFVVDGDFALTSVYYDFHGTHITAAWSQVGASNDLLYDTVTFDYKPVGTNTAKIALAHVSGSKYYGYYTFTSTGTVDKTTGVSITTLDDGYFRVVMTTASLAWTNGANNLNNVPDSIHCIITNTASDWYIDNVIFYKACTVTVTNGTGGTTVNYGTSVTVTANDPATGKAFLCWKNGSDEIVSRNVSYTFDIFGDVSLTACYADKVSVSASGGTVNGGSSANVGDGSIVTLVANAPATGYYFLKWTNTAGDVVATTATANVVVDGATTYTANYRAYDGTKYAANTSHSILPTYGKPFSRVSFEYKIASGEQSSFALLNSWTTYYGYFAITQNGLLTEYDGVSVELLDDGYYSVSIDVEDVTKMAGTLDPATSSITQIFINKNGSNAEIYIRSVTFTEETGVFRMYEGASVRLTDPYGIRFRAFMSYDMYDEDATYGMIILPYDYITSNEINLEGDVIAQLNAKSVKYRNFTCVPVRMASTDYYIQGSITNILEKNLTREFIGIGYYISNGDYYYVQNATSCRRTIVGVSESAIKNYETFTGYTAEKQEFLLETSGSDGEAAGAAFSANAFDSIENFKKNDSVSTSATLTLSAAKGESEFGQIVLTATSTVANKAYIIIPDDLTHSDGSTVLGKANFELFNAYYTDVDSNWVYWNTSTYSYATPISTGYYVNALVPFYAASASSEAVFDRTNGDNQTIFVRFNVPADQKAGVYTGSFRIYVLGVGYKDVSVSFTVNNFTLPEENNYKTKFGISEWDIKAVFGTTHERTSEEYTELYELLLDYNLNGGQIPASMYNSAVAINGYIAKLVEYYNDPKVAAIQLYCSDGTAYYEYQKSRFSAIQKYTLSSVIHEYDWTDSDGITNYGTRSMLKAIAEYCVENDINLFEKLYFRLNDEPNTPETCIQAILSYNAVKNGIDYALSKVDFTGHVDIENSLRYLPYFVTCSPSAEVEDAYGATVLALYSGNKFVDSVNSKTAYYPADSNNSKQSITINYTYLTDYVPTFKSVIGSEKDSRVYSLRTDSDPETHVWWYSMITTVNPYPHYVVNANQIINRSKTWATYYYGIEGELYYCVNDWKHYYYDAQGKGASDQLDEEAIWNGEDVYYGGYEEGTLVYPNVTRYAGDFKFCPTYRLVATSEGIDDYNYICYAQSLIDAMATGSAKTAAQNSLNTCIDSMVNQDATNAIINSSASTLRTARNNLIALIEELVGN